MHTRIHLICSCDIKNQFVLKFAFVTTPSLVAAHLNTPIDDCALDVVLSPYFIFTFSVPAIFILLIVLEIQTPIY